VGDWCSDTPFNRLALNACAKELVKKLLVLAR
jgi:hypothetical protein